MHGLRTWWVDAVGTTALTLHVDPAALVAGALGANAAALAGIVDGDASAGETITALAVARGYARPRPQVPRAPRPCSASPAPSVAAALIAAVRGGMLEATGGFFGAGGALLVSGLLLARARLLAGADGGHERRRVAGVWALGQSHTAWRPTRTVLTLSLIAFATFVLVSVVAFRRDGATTSLEPAGGTGGFALHGRIGAAVDARPEHAARAARRWASMPGAPWTAPV